jgi:hypothetical protein
LPSLTLLAFVAAPIETSAMQYETFRLAFEDALRESKLGMIGLWGEETLNLRSLDRTYEVHVHPLGKRDGGPFWVSASISFRWDSLTTARTSTREEEALTTIFGPGDVPKRRTTKPWTRIDIKLNASLSDGKELPMPSSRAWASWAEATMGRLEEVAPLTPKEKVRENKAGRLEILAWQGEPAAELRIGPEGDLRLRALHIEGFQIMETPRSLDTDKRPDEEPYAELRAMFHRVQASLMAWTQALDHLRAKSRVGGTPDRRH